MLLKDTCGRPKMIGSLMHYDPSNSTSKKAQMADALLMAKPQNAKETQACDQENVPPPAAVELPNHQIATSGMAASAPESAHWQLEGGRMDFWLPRCC